MLAACAVLANSTHCGASGILVLVCILLLPVLPEPTRKAALDATRPALIFWQACLKIIKPRHATHQGVTLLRWTRVHLYAVYGYVTAYS